MLSLADPGTKDDPHFDNQKEESFPVGPNYLAETFRCQGRPGVIVGQSSAKIPR